MHAIGHRYVGQKDLFSLLFWPMELVSDSPIDRAIQSQKISITFSNLVIIEVHYWSILLFIDIQYVDVMSVDK